MSRLSFRLFVLYFVALSFIKDARINAFTIRKSYNVTDGPPEDLSVGESLQLEVRHDLKRPNGIDGDVLNKSSESSTTYNINNTKGIGVATFTIPQIATTATLTEPYINSDIIETSSANDESKGLSKKLHILEPFTSQSLRLSNNNVSNVNSTLIKQINDMDNSMTVSVEEIKARVQPRYKSTADKKGSVTDLTSGQNKGTIEQENVQTTNTYFTVPEGTEFVTYSTNKNNDHKATNFPPWKKYAVIDRKRVPVGVLTTQSTMVHEETATETINDSITSDSSPSERKVGDLHPSMLEISTSDFARSTPNYQDITDTQNLIKTTKSDETQPEILTLETVFSKRAGFLNLSSKSKETDATTVSYIFETTIGSDILSTLEPNLDERMKSTFADGSESQRHLEDAVKEVLLQETSLNNNEEMTTQNLDEVLNTGITPATAERFNTEVTSRETETDVTDVDVTPYSNSSKVKGTKMYAVNPNYKPMKKIEVQPPKTFVRDPDDNSWRNESISSLGIVFKPKNSSKPFTQVLKNKTEIEWSNLLSKDSKNDLPDLRERLEKIALKRKTKKKKADVFGNIIYGDYEESNSSEEVTNTERIDLTPTSVTTEETTMFNEFASSTLHSITTQTPDTVTTPESMTSTHSDEIATTTSTPESDTHINKILAYIPLTEVNTTPNTIETDSPTTTYTTLLTTKITTLSSDLKFTQGFLPKQVIKGPSTTEKQKKIFKVFEYYDGSDEDDNEYLELAKLELKKKNTAPLRITNALFTTLPPLPYRFTALPPYLPDRKPTIQYFPPRSTKPPKPNIFNNQFDKKTKYNLRKTSPKNFAPITVAPDIHQPAPVYVLDSPLPNLSQTQHYHNLEQSTIKPDDTLLPLQLPNMYKSNEYTRNLYQTTPQAIKSVQNNAHVVADRNKGFNRATYAVKNYKDFLEQAVKDYDYERDAEYVRYTESPLRGVTISDLVAQEKDRVKANFNYDYDVKFRKEVLQRFVDNFSHNEARYNDDFPVLYNNTVMHVDLTGNGGEAIASSRAFLKGLYNPSDTKLGYARREPYDVNCDKCTVELSPAYELHYYVPDQEEKEEAEPKPTGIPLP